jgi:hypothetical protein
MAASTPLMPPPRTIAFFIALFSLNAPLHSVQT